MLPQAILPSLHICGWHCAELFVWIDALTTNLVFFFYFFFPSQFLLSSPFIVLCGWFLFLRTILLLLPAPFFMCYYLDKHLQHTARARPCLCMSCYRTVCPLLRHSNWPKTSPPCYTNPDNFPSACRLIQAATTPPATLSPVPASDAALAGAALIGYCTMPIHVSCTHHFPFQPDRPAGAHRSKPTCTRDYQMLKRIAWLMKVAELCTLYVHTLPLLFILQLCHRVLSGYMVDDYTTFY